MPHACNDGKGALDHKQQAFDKLTQIRKRLQGYTNIGGADYGSKVGNVSCGSWEYRAGASARVVWIDSDVSGNPRKADTSWYDHEARRNNTSRAPQSQYDQSHEKCSEIRTLEGAQKSWDETISRAERPLPITLRIYSENMPCRRCRMERLGRFVKRFAVATIVVYYRNRRQDDDKYSWSEARDSDGWYEHTLSEPQAPDAEESEKGTKDDEESEKGTKDDGGWTPASAQNHGRKSEQRRRNNHKNATENEEVRQKASEKKELEDYLKQNRRSKAVRGMLVYYRENKMDSPWVKGLSEEASKMYDRLKNNELYDPKTDSLKKDI